MKDIKPIKRDAALVRSSKHHHVGLLLVWKIREGLKNHIEPRRISKYVVHFFETELIPHFNDEEKLLFAKLSGDDAMKLRAEQEHADIRELINSITQQPDNKNL